MSIRGTEKLRHFEETRQSPSIQFAIPSENIDELTTDEERENWEEEAQERVEALRQCSELLRRMGCTESGEISPRDNRIDLVNRLFQRIILEEDLDEITLEELAKLN